ncbi:hypothetical protein ACH5RR_032609 [Cinchona calisaya]|uniref:Uncharacterized protein n=1 Tax=Cinchona calisaya TaxID=153742 RepID=A0ABD2YMZ9_9GENT
MLAGHPPEDCLLATLVQGVLVGHPLRGVGWPSLKDIGWSPLQEYWLDAPSESERNVGKRARWMIRSSQAAGSRQQGNFRNTDKSREPINASRDKLKQCEIYQRFHHASSALSVQATMAFPMLPGYDDKGSCKKHDVTSKVSSQMHIPSSFLYIQCATVFAIYQKYFNSIYDGLAEIDLSISIQLPDLPLFSTSNLPAIVMPSSPYFAATMPILHEHDYLRRLDSKPENSVVYVSFGSLVTITKGQKRETFHRLEEVGRAYYLMVIRESNNEDKVKKMMEDGESRKGMIGPWCSQMEVLCHKSIGCFITHRGWNSTMESLVAGVPTVSCPQFSNQTTNVKLIEEVRGNGVRAKANAEGSVLREEIYR